jgi:hypothetical protein
MLCTTAVFSTCLLHAGVVLFDYTLPPFEKQKSLFISKDEKTGFVVPPLFTNQKKVCALHYDNGIHPVFPTRCSERQLQGDIQQTFIENLTAKGFLLFIKGVAYSSLSTLVGYIIYNFPLNRY